MFLPICMAMTLSFKWEHVFVRRTAKAQTEEQVAERVHPCMSQQVQLHLLVRAVVLKCAFSIRSSHKDVNVRALPWHTFCTQGLCIGVMQGDVS